MPYRCQLIEKIVQSDHVDHGCEYDGRASRIVMDSRAHRAREADTAHDAIAAAFADFDLPVDYFFVSDTGAAGLAPYIGCNRNEDGDGTPVDGSDSDPRARALSDAGQLWLADYSFAVEYVEHRALTLAELRDAFPTATIEA